MLPLFHPRVTAETLQSNRGGFSKLLGIELHEVGPDYLKARLVVEEKHLRIGGIVNGSVYLSLIESVGSVAGSLVADLQQKNTVGIQVSANHVRSSRVGDTLLATARPKHLGRKMHVWIVEIENQDKKLISEGTLTLMVVDGLSA